MSKKFWMGFFMLLFLSVVVADVHAVSAIDGFNPDANGSVYSVVVQSDGKILIGGCFTKIGNQTRNCIARLNPDGTLDETFDPNVKRELGADDEVSFIAIQSDGKIVITGYFDKVGGQTRNNIARLNQNGTIDETFRSNIDGPVFCGAIQSDGKIVIVISGRGLENDRMVRLNTDGTIDMSFNSNVNVNGEVFAILVRSDGRILIGGSFTSIGGQTRNKIAGLNSDGTLDQTFNPNFEGCKRVTWVTSFLVQSDGKILVGGEFGEFEDVSKTQGLVRLNVDGTRDMAFNPDLGISCIADGMSIQPDGKVLVRGTFFYYDEAIGWDLNHRSLMRVNPDGTCDTEFNSNVSVYWKVWTISVQHDGKLLIGGGFSDVNGQERNHIARLNSDGTLDATLDPNANSYVYATAIQPDGKILIGGTFTKVGGQTRNCIARLNLDGTLDVAFDPNVSSKPNTDGAVYSIAVQSDGKILVGGFFAKVEGQTRNNIARLDSDGTLDAIFNPNASGGVYSIIAQSDGKILVGGNFTKIGGYTRNRIAMIEPGGTVNSFDPNANGAVSSISVQSDGKILIGGYFTNIGGQTRNRIARLKSNGTVDSFDPNANNAVHSISVQSDGKILVGGDFTNVGGYVKNRIAMLSSEGAVDSFNPDANGSIHSISIQADGKILIGGWFTKIGGRTKKRIARLDSGGTVDTTFNLDANGHVYSIVSQSDGKVLVGGGFTNIGGQTRNRIARLTNTNASFQDISTSADGSAVIWKRSGAAPELYRVTFEISDDMDSWTTLGPGYRVAGGWEITNLVIPKDTNLYVRAMGYAAGGRRSGSTSIIEFVKNVYLSDE